MEKTPTTFICTFWIRCRAGDTASDMLAVVRIVNALFAIFNRSSQYNNDN